MAVSDGSSPRDWLISIHKAVSEGLALEACSLKQAAIHPFIKFKTALGVFDSRL